MQGLSVWTGTSIIQLSEATRFLAQEKAGFHDWWKAESLTLHECKNCRAFRKAQGSEGQFAVNATDAHA